MGHIVGDDGISTTGLAANADIAREHLEKTMPWVKEVKFPSVPEETSSAEKRKCVENFVKEMAAKYGEYHDIEQITQKPTVSLAADIDFVTKVKKGYKPS